jgi:hypothetical protein
MKTRGVEHVEHVVYWAFAPPACLYVTGYGIGLAFAELNTAVRISAISARHMASQSIRPIVPSRVVHHPDPCTEHAP